MKKLAVSGLAVLLVIAVTYAFAAGPGPDTGRGDCGGFGKHGKWASLSPEQKAKFQDLRTRFHEETAYLREAMVAKGKECRSLWQDPNADPNAIIEKQKEMRTLRDQIMDKETQMMLEARHFLTAEQISEWGPGCGPGFGKGGARGLGGGPAHRGRCW